MSMYDARTIKEAQADIATYTRRIARTENKLAHATDPDDIDGHLEMLAKYRAEITKAQGILK